MTSTRINEMPNAYSTTYLIEAPTEEEVDLAVERLMGRYIPTGYGTQVRKKNRTATGWQAEVWRSNSCE